MNASSDDSLLPCSKAATVYFLVSRIWNKKHWSLNKKLEFLFWWCHLFCLCEFWQNTSLWTCWTICKMRIIISVHREVLKKLNQIQAEVLKCLISTRFSVSKESYLFWSVSSGHMSMESVNHRSLNASRNKFQYVFPLIPKVNV